MINTNMKYWSWMGVMLPTY
ncbi:hypothetical protein [Escherichia coli]